MTINNSHFRFPKIPKFPGGLLNFEHRQNPSNHLSLPRELSLVEQLIAARKLNSPNLTNWNAKKNKKKACAALSMARGERSFTFDRALKSAVVYYIYITKGAAGAEGKLQQNREFGNNFLHNVYSHKIWERLQLFCLCAV